MNPRTIGNKYKSNIWKDKYRLLKNAKKYSDKKIKRLTDRNLELKIRLREVKAELKQLKKAIEDGKPCAKICGEKPARHAYGATLIYLCIWFQTSLGFSYRGTSAAMKKLLMVMKADCKAPSPTAIRNWVHKSSQSALNQPVEATDELVLIIDESAAIGREKVLLILSAPLGNVGKGALKFEDMRVLSVTTSHSWKTDEIARKIEEVKARVGGRISYVISDGGTNIRAEPRRRRCGANADCVR